MASTRIHVPAEWADILKSYKELGVELPAPAVTGKTLVSQDRKIEKISAEKKLLSQRIHHLQTELQEAYKRNEVVDQLAASNEVPKIVPKSNHLSESVVVAVASDWHAEEKVDPKTIQGAPNEFNPQIFKARADRFFSKIVYLTEMVRAKTKVDVMVLALLGDFINGYIHEEMEESNYMSPIEASLLVKKTLRSGIDYLMANAGIKKLLVPCCHGNHGRTGQIKKVATAAQNSYEWLIYKDLEDLYSKNKNIEFYVADGYHQYLDVYDYTLRFHHGDSIAYGGGIGGITIPVRKAIANWNTIKRAYLDVFGHFHQFTDGGNFISNGSLVGYGAYALHVKAPYERPQQAFFTIDKKHGKTVVCPIILENPNS